MNSSMHWLEIGIRGVTALHRILIDLVAVWRSRREMRFELERLTETGDWLVSDIGLTREAAEREAAKPFWRL